MSPNDGKARVSKLKNEIVPDLVKNGKFGDGLSLKEVRLVDSDNGTDHWASSTFFAEVHLEDQRKVKTIKRLIVKIPPINPILREFYRSHLMYGNEVAFYRDIFPKYREFVESRGLGDLCDGLIPECYHAEFDPERPENAVVVLDDLREYGYRPSKQKRHLDLVHVKKALTQLAKFHGMGYAMKLSEPEAYRGLTSKIQHLRCNPDHPEPEDIFFTMSVSTTRPIDRLLNNNDGDVTVDDLKKLKAIFENTFQVMKDSLEPSSLTVLNHGDFNVNNVLYHYDSRDNPDGLRIIDFQTPYYASPGIDLSFFLFINTDEDFRNQHLKEVLQHYHAAVIDTMEKVLGRKVVEPEFEFQEFRKDFAQHAVFGYIIYSFFNPMMINIEQGQKIDMGEKRKKAKTQTREERRKDVLAEGGERATLEAVKIFQEYYSRGYFEHLLNSDFTHL